MVFDASQSALWTLDAAGGLRPLREPWLVAALDELLPGGPYRAVARAALADLDRCHPHGGFVDPGDLQDRLWLDLVSSGEVRHARVLARPPRRGEGVTVRGGDGAAYQVDRGRLLRLLEQRCRHLEGVDPDRLSHEAAEWLVPGLDEAVLGRVLAPYGRAWLGALGGLRRH